ncbi:MAG: hypothetical protein Q4E55_07710 [Bacteroidales bacterium]|nr:hypothetical protein [Bacteroidales bacterium]
MRLQNKHTSPHSRLAVRLLCEALLILFSGLYIVVYQSDLIYAMHCSALLTPTAHASAIVCGTILVVGIMLARLLQKLFRPRLSMTAWTYFPVYLVEALLTDITLQDNQIAINSMWTWLAPTLFVGLLTMLLCGRKSSATHNSLNAGTWGSSIFFTAMFMLMVCTLGNTETVFHKETIKNTRTEEIKNIETENIIQ